MPRQAKEAYNEYMRDYMLARYKRRMAAAREFLGGKCAKCGATGDLDLDHIDPTTKSFTIARMWSVSDEKFWAEVKKCQLLCSDGTADRCHRAKHRKEARHGTWTRSRAGCQCDVCVEGERERNRRYKQNAKQTKRA